MPTAVLRPARTRSPFVGGPFGVPPTPVAVLPLRALVVYGLVEPWHGSASVLRLPFRLTSAPSVTRPVVIAGPGEFREPVTRLAWVLAPPPPPAVAPISIYLGRFRLGDKVSFSVSIPGLPDGIPTATVTDGVTSFVRTVPPVSLSPPVLGLSFRMPYASPGTFTLTVSCSVAGSPFSSVFTFDVVVGGDSGAEVVSLVAADTPTGRSVLAHLGSGRLASGNNPRL